MTALALVLSVFPGIGLLDRGFEGEGYAVVRGPDLIFGGDIKKFNAPAGRFDGVIGGPPCQAFSTLRHLILATGGKLAENLIPEYERVCSEAQPTWFLMENVPDAPEPVVPGYVVRSLLLNNRWCPDADDSLIGAEQNRERRFSFGTRDGRTLKPRVAVFDAPRKTLAVMAAGGGVRCPLRSADQASGNGGDFDGLEPLPSTVLSHPVNPEPSTVLAPVSGAVMACAGKSGGSLSERDAAKGGRGPRGEILAPVGAVTANGTTGTTWDREKKRARSNRSTAYFREACRLQGLPEDFALPGFTVEAKIRAVGNGVPLPMARAIARAVREAIDAR